MGQRSSESKGLIGKALLCVIILIQLMGAIYLCNHTYAGGDGIFTFTLANTPYEFNYIDSKIGRFPNNNGWMNAGILREQYETMSYDRFNYSSVYWHQRIDNHPLLYYSLVHTACSLFPESYSIWYALIFNLVALLFIDLILIRVARFLFPEHVAAPAVMLVAATSIVAFYEMAALARMYMLLALMAVWFLWICIRLVYGERVSLWEIYLCVLLGSQTHYYDYVFAALAGFITLCMMARDHAWRRIWEVVRTTGMAVCTSLIIFPWVVWHIVFNQMDKNTTLRMWDLETLTGWLAFVNESVFNGRGIVWIVLAAAAVICAAFGRGKATTETDSVDPSARSLRRFWILCGVSTLIFSMGIYTLNGAVRYYATPVYLPSAIMMAALVMTLCQAFRTHWGGSRCISRGPLYVWPPYWPYWEGSPRTFDISLQWRRSIVSISPSIRSRWIIRMRTACMWRRAMTTCCRVCGSTLLGMMNSARPMSMNMRQHLQREMPGSRRSWMVVCQTARLFSMCR